MEIFLQALPHIITFGIGFLLKSPIFNKTISVTEVALKALEDKKLTASEIRGIIEAINE